jgi:hypothetical protein
METSLVRQQVRQTIDRARHDAKERRARADDAARAYEPFLQNIAVPLFRQIADALKASQYPFSVMTPSGSVRLTSDKSAEDYIELTLDTSGDRPAVIGHASRSRGRRVIESERPIADVPVGEITEDQLLAFLLHEIAPFVER